MALNSVEPVIHIENFRMVFGKNTVIRDLSFDVRQGEIFGFLGSNGSGKTSTIRALLGIYQATSGVMHINGRTFTPESGGNLGYLPEERGLYKKESVIDVMSYFGRLKGLDRATSIKWSLKYLERVSLAEKAKTRLDKLSSGQQQKVQLGVTLMNDPSLLILDEPTKGFDPVNRRLLMNIINEHKQAGATVLMVTHQMEEVEQLCDRIILLKDGVAQAYGTISQVQDQFGDDVLHVSHKGEIPSSVLYEILRQDEGRSELKMKEGAGAAEILTSLVSQGIEINSFFPKKRSLDDIFVEIYGNEAEKDEA